MAEELVFSVSGKSQASPDILTRQFREIAEYLVLAHATGEIL